MIMQPLPSLVVVFSSRISEINFPIIYHWDAFALIFHIVHVIRWKYFVFLFLKIFWIQKFVLENEGTETKK